MSGQRSGASALGLKPSFQVHASSLGLSKRDVKTNLNQGCLSFAQHMSAMDDHRKKRLQQLVDGSPYFGNQAKFAEAAKLSKGRITQLLDPKEAFGERTARAIENRLRMESMWFDKGSISQDASWPFTSITPEQFYSLGEDVRSAAEAGLAAVVRSGELAAKSGKRKPPKTGT